MNTLKITRKQYMQDSENLHHEYYKQLVTKEFLTYLKNKPRLLQLCKDSKKESFNSVSLSLWDSLPVGSFVNSELLSELGETRSLCTYVCIAKTAVRIILTKEKELQQ